MPPFDSAIEDIADRFSLGPQAGPLVREVVQMITGWPGGLGGFIGKLRSAGFGSQVNSWLGRTDGAALSASQVETALGGNVLGGIASRLGLAGGVVGPAIGYLLPKVIGQMTPGGVVPSGSPSLVSEFFGQTPTRRGEQVAPTAMHVIPDAQHQVAPTAMHVIPDAHPHLGRWLIPLLAGLGVIGLLWYLFSGISPTRVATNTAPAVQMPPPAPAPSVPARLTLSNDNGVITYSGRTHDDATRTSIVDALKDVFGADNVKGNIAVDANAGPAPWLVNLRTALNNFRTPGTQAVFDGDSVRVGGQIGDADRNGILNSLRSVFGTDTVLGALTNGAAPAGQSNH